MEDLRLWNWLRKSTNFLYIQLLPGLSQDAKLWISTPRIRYSKTIMRIATKTIQLCTM